MAIGSTALAHFLIVLIIGIVVGLFFNRYAHTWLSRLGNTTHSDITSALVGIAGSFIGFHLAVISTRSCFAWLQSSALSSFCDWAVDAG